MAKEQQSAGKLERYRSEGKATVRFMAGDLTESLVGNYEGLGYEVEKVEPTGHVIMSTTSERAEKNRLEAIAKHHRQVRPSAPYIGGEGSKVVELTDERRPTPDMAPTLGDL